MSPDHEHTARLIEISQQPRSLLADLREVWNYRDLLGLLVARDVSIRYKQSALGPLWALLQPIILMTTFSIVFGRFAKLPSDGYPYPLFVLCGLIPWTYFSRSLAGASDSLVSASGLVSKVYFPRLILPLSKTLSGLVDLAIAFVLMVVVLFWYRVIPGWQLLLLPMFILISLATALSIGLWLTALNVKYRDVGLLVPFVVQVWMYASPIAYSTSIVPSKWLWIYSLNPMVGVVEGFRWSLLGKSPPDPVAMAVSGGIMLALFVSGLAYFRRTERTFADVI